MKLLQTKTSCFSNSPFANNENSLKNGKIPDERFFQQIQSYFFQSLKNNYEENSKISCKNKGRNYGYFALPSAKSPRRAARLASILVAFFLIVNRSKIYNLFQRVQNS